MKRDGKQRRPRSLVPTAAAAIAGCLLIGACALVVRGPRDYAFDVTVVVLDEQGHPLPEAVVILATGRVVFEAVTPVTSVERPTDSTGGCVFMYIAHQSSVSYAVTVRKEGYVPQVLTGVAAPYAHLKVQLVQDQGAQRNGREVPGHNEAGGW